MASKGVRGDSGEGGREEMKRTIRESVRRSEQESAET
jgi:hypothetical protein